MQGNGRRTIGLALAAAAVLAAGVVLSFVVTLRGPDGERSRPDALRRDVAVSPPPRRSPPATDGGAATTRLAPVAAATRTASERANVDEELWSPPDAPPAPDRRRILGRVVDEEGAPVAATGAVVSVIRDDEWTDERIVLGRVPVAPNGRFWIDLPPYPPWEYLFLQLVAPGYAWSETEVRPKQFDEGVAEVTLETSRGGLYVRGRVVDARGEAVPSARVRVVEWGGQGSNLESQELDTTTDGVFESEISWMGWVDALAHHPSHGIAKAGRRMEAGEAVLDLGDLTLAPTSTVAGVVRGLGGAPIARAEVLLEPTEEFPGAHAQQIPTDAEGRFRFAALEAIPYRASTELEKLEFEERPLVVPDVLDLVLRVPVPTAILTTLDPSGRAFDPDGLDSAALPGQPKKDEHWSRIERIERGRYQVVFGGTGRYRLVAEHERDDVRWFATVDVDAGRQPANVTLRVAPPQVTEVRFDVARSTGEAARDWRVRVRDPATGTSLGVATSRKRSCRIPPGTWIAYVSPRNGGMFLPFERTLSIPDDAAASVQTVELTADEEGGRVEVVVRSVRTGAEGTVGLALRRRGETRTAFEHTAWQFRDEPFHLGRVFPAGAYALRAWPSPGGGLDDTRAAEFDVVAGETARVQITIP
ncbi:MAG: carboxypeptidase-like regulatory domain-containing protein [Planctomycetota bacterium]